MRDNNPMKKSDKDLKWYNDTIKMLDNAERNVQDATDRRDFIKNQLESFDQEMINKYKLTPCYCGDIPDIITGNMTFPYVQCSCGERTNPTAFVLTAITEWNEKRSKQNG